MRPAPSRADAGLVAHLLRLAHALGLPLVRGHALLAPAFDPIRMVDARNRLQEPGAFLIGNAGEHGAVAGNRLEQCGGVAQALEYHAVVGIGRWSAPGHLSMVARRW